MPALTLYAFSAQNWGRPPDEVRHLMDLLCAFLRDEQDELVARGIRLETIGDAGRLPATVRRLLSITRQATARHRRTTLCLAFRSDGRATSERGSVRRNHPTAGQTSATSMIPASR